MTDIDEIRAEWLADHPGHPLGSGYPTGSTLRGEDGTTHLAGWADVVRRDACAYCGGPAGTLDHIVPQGTRRPGVHSWLNYTGACEWCNGRKSDRNLLAFLLLPPREPKATPIRVKCRVSPEGARRAA